ncbi:sporulation related protein [Roseiarcus fermentans]|uniref:Sporulation related protein n=1 Tax=Roseiarcus fermentans TaxID=1473586 RepID=A0A366EHR4_9HYPH|nr:SPOR domain-containing protein [Roseiarcus fermentans]RBP00965.1 sporulation related protein [Roseiarcus fermentans]
MSVSGSRSAVDIDLDDLERRLRAAGAPSGVVEDPLAELARLVEASRPKAAEAPRPVAAPAPPAAAPLRPVAAAAPPVPAATAPPALRAGELRPAFDAGADRAAEPVETDREAEAVDGQEEPPFDPYPVQPPAPSEALRARPRSSRWLWTVSGLALAGVAMIGAVFVLKGGVPGMPKAPPYIAAAVGPTKVQPPSDATVSSASDAGANLLKDTTQSSKVNVVSNEEQPVDLNAQTAPATTASTGTGGGTAVRGTVDTPVVIAPPPAAPAGGFPEPKPVRTISLRPDGTPIPALAGDGAPGLEAPKPQAKPAAKAPSDAANAQASTPKLDLPTKLSPKSSARVVVAKTDTTAPGGAADMAGEPAAKPEKAAKAKPQDAAVATAPEPAAPAAGEPAAASSGGWAVQLAAPRSEAEAKTVVSKLGSKYASALGGSALGVHKGTTSNGDTVYRVRVTSLSKADAASLCARVKGDGGDCFVTR